MVGFGPSPFWPQRKAAPDTPELDSENPQLSAGENKQQQQAKHRQHKTTDNNQLSKKPPETNERTTRKVCKAPWPSAFWCASIAGSQVLTDLFVALTGRGPGAQKPSLNQRDSSYLKTVGSQPVGSVNAFCGMPRFASVRCGMRVFPKGRSKKNRLFGFQKTFSDCGVQLKRKC